MNVTRAEAPAAEAGGTGQASFASLQFQAMGTSCRVDFACRSTAAANAFKALVVEWVGRFEARFSRFREDSLVSRINRAAGRERVELDEESEGLFALCDWFHWLTKGVFDPSSLPLIRLWDYHGGHPAVPADPTVRDALSRVGWQRVKHGKGSIYLPEEGMGIDLGGIAKEYAVDRVMEMALERGMRNVLVNFGNDLRVHGEPPEGGAWRVGLEDPYEPGFCWGGVALSDRAVTTSGNYLRFFEANGQRYGHIIDPRTGYPVSNDCASVSAVAPTCTEAGILCTAAFVLGGEEGLRLLEASPSTQGCLWVGRRRMETSGFQSYLIRKGVAR